MPIHYSSGGIGDFASAAGQAAAPISDKLRQMNSDLLRNQERNEYLQARQSEAAARRSEREADEDRRAGEAFRKGLQKSLELGAEMGFATDWDGFQALDDALLAADEEVYAQIAAAAPMPQSADDLAFPTAFILRSEALKSVRTVRSAEAKNEAWSQFEREAETSGYTEDEVAGVLALKEDPDVSFDEYKLEAESVREAARMRVADREQREMAKGKARALFQEYGGQIATSSQLQDLASRLMAGQSERPLYDLMKLTMGAQFGEGVYGELEMEAFNRAMVALKDSQREAERKAEAKVQWGRDMAREPYAPGMPMDEYAPTTPDTDFGAQAERDRQEGAVQYEEEGAPIASVSEAKPEPEGERVPAEEEAAFQEWAATSGLDMSTPAKRVAAERKWVQFKKAQAGPYEAHVKRSAAAAEKAQSPGGRLHAGATPTTSLAQEARAVLQRQGVDMTDRAEVAKGLAELARKNPRKWGELAWGITYVGGEK